MSQYFNRQQMQIWADAKIQYLNYGSLCVGFDCICFSYVCGNRTDWDFIQYLNANNVNGMVASNLIVILKPHKDRFKKAERKIDRIYKKLYLWKWLTLSQVYFYWDLIVMRYRHYRYGKLK